MGLFKKNTPPKVKVVRTNISGHISKRSKPLRRTPAISHSPLNAGRSFEAGKKTRLTEDWNYGLHNNLNLDLRSYKKEVDNRSEDLVKNNPYIAGYLLRETANVIGDKGFLLQVKTTFPDGTLDEFANTFIENKFKQWSKKEFCTMSGRHSFVRVQWMILNSLLTNGEYLIKKVTNVDVNENPFAFSLEMLDPRDIDINYSAILTNGHVVLMGVEIDEWRKIHRVYLRPSKIQNETLYSSGEYLYERDREFIDAKDIYFDFESITQFGIKQIRGFTPLASAMLLMKSIDRWEGATLTNATLTARKMGFLIRKNMEGQKFVGSTTTNSSGKEVEQKGADGGYYMDFEEGSIEELPMGYEFLGWDPKYPHEQHEMFVRNNLKKFATSRGINYNSFANDYGGVTFSSLRAGAVDERDIWMLKQTLIRESFLVNLYPDWLYWGLLSQALKPLQFQNMWRYENHIWQGKRWKWVKPLEDVTAKEKSVANMFESPIQVAAELGNDWEEIKKDFKKVKSFADEMGVSPQWLMNLISKAKTTEDDVDPNEDPDEADAKELIFNIGNTK